MRFFASVRVSMFTVRIFVLSATMLDMAIGQGAQMVGGRPPTTVTHELCDIASVFSQLSAIKTNPDCTAGCAQGSGQCPADWYPGAACASSRPRRPPGPPSDPAPDRGRARAGTCAAQRAA